MKPLIIAAIAVACLAQKMPPPPPPQLAPTPQKPPLIDLVKTSPTTSEYRHFGDGGALMWRLASDGTFTVYIGARLNNVSIRKVVVERMP